MNPRNMELLRKTDGNGVNYTGTVSVCNICAWGKSQQKAQPKTTKHKTDGPMELVYTDLMGPITPAAKGGYTYISKFTDDFSRMKEIFLLKCLLKDGKFPRNMWGELFFAAVYLSNRSPHSALGGATPFSKLHGKETVMSDLRTIGARAFVHIETHTTKLGDKAWKGKLCGFSENSRVYQM
ncbi:unnamed protein product, partial [Laminaria digitata]